MFELKAHFPMEIPIILVKKEHILGMSQPVLIKGGGNGSASKRQVKDDTHWVPCGLRKAGVTLLAP